jgi:ankyrin repeat protein
MPERHLPVRPDLRQLKHQAKDLLKAIRRGDADGIAELREHHPHPPSREHAKLADAQLALARAYGAESWGRLVVCCQLIHAIWKDDVKTVRTLVLANPKLVHEDARIRTSNWGPPLSYAANLGRDRIIALLTELGATDFMYAINRAALQGEIETARMLHQMAGSPKPSSGMLGGPAYTLSVTGTQFLFDIGADVHDWEGRQGSPLEVVLGTDARDPAAKHTILEMYLERGLSLPDTPMMALHRGRIDLLEDHLRRDPGLLGRTFTFAEIFPPETGCPQPGPYDDHLPRTPLGGSTLLHLSVEFDEIDIARWLLGRGMHPDESAAMDRDGFGGHTALFNAVVSFSNFEMNREPAPTRVLTTFAKLLLDAGANPNTRASFRYRFDAPEGRILREVRDITPVDWGKVFHDRRVVNEPAMKVIAAATRASQ